MEIAPGGLVVERGVIATEAPMPAVEAATPGEDTLPVETATLNAVAEEPAEEIVSPPNEGAPPESTVTIGGTISGVTLEAVVVPAQVIEIPLPPETTAGGPLLGTPIPTAEGEAPPAATSVPPYILPPAEAYAGQELRMITVILRPGVDKVRDNLRLRQCYGILISYSGHDRFALQIFERTRGYRIEFPNYTTAHCAELLARLASIVGAENIIVESLRLH